MRRTGFVLVACWMVVVVIAGPGLAITGGQPDEGRHPSVGGTVITIRDRTFVSCTGTLISSTVFLTAAHCGTDGRRFDVTFDEVFDPETSPRHSGTFHTHPGHDPAHPRRNDVAVIVLDEPVGGITPARLPAAGLLDSMKADGSLDQSTKFTAVGYGFQGFEFGPGGPARIPGQSRRFAVGSFDALTPDHLHLSQNEATGDGGTCWGDSGGPNFLGAGEAETDVVASITQTGDTYCQATNDTYRIDTENVLSFLDDYVALP